jgi:hypothetical protein
MLEVVLQAVMNDRIIKVTNILFISSPVSDKKIPAVAGIFVQLCLESYAE